MTTRISKEMKTRILLSVFALGATLCVAQPAVEAATYDIWNNRQAYYADISSEPEDISALISIDMNGLKTINDTEGHTAGDKAISTIASCFLRAAKRKQFVYRVGGDEFVVVCRKVSEEEVINLTKRIHEQVNATPYSCSIGYSYSTDGKKPIDQLLSESDANMYAEKQLYYKANNKAPRNG